MLQKIQQRVLGFCEPTENASISPECPLSLVTGASLAEDAATSPRGSSTVLADAGTAAADIVTRGSVVTHGFSAPVIWHSSFESALGAEASGAVVNDTATSGNRAASFAAPMLLVAHELFDALPVYQFQYTDR